jgi:hypothetical protein
MKVRALGVGIDTGRTPKEGKSGLVRRVIINAVSGTTQPVSNTQRLISSIIISVTTGAIDVWIGESGSGPGQFRVIPSHGPVQLWLPECDYSLFWSVPMDTVACITLLGPGG